MSYDEKEDSKLNDGQTPDIKEETPNEQHFIERNEYTPDFLTKGGIVIMGNSSDELLLNENNFINTILQGFYDNLKQNDPNEIYLDQIADHVMTLYRNVSESDLDAVEYNLGIFDESEVDYQKVDSESIRMEQSPQNNVNLNELKKEYNSSVS